MFHTNDPADELREKIGNIEDIEVSGNFVLAAIYQRPEKTKSGLFLADSTRDEDKYQGKVALILKCGPLVGDAECAKWFGGDQRVIKEGQWIVLRPSDGWQVNVNKTECRMVQDTHIKMRVSAPDSIW